MPFEPGSDIITQRQYFGELPLVDADHSNKKATFPHKRLAFDLDGVLFEDVKDIDIYYRDNLPLTPIAGGKQVTSWLKSLGYTILVHTCRPDYHNTYLKEQLSMAGIKVDLILYYTKPRVDLYIDDKGYHFTGFEKLRTDMEEMIAAGNLPINLEPKPEKIPIQFPPTPTLNRNLFNGGDYSFQMWDEFWDEIEKWYGDVQKKETQAQFTNRLHQKFMLYRRTKNIEG